jgi:hypothetical protein
MTLHFCALYSTKQAAFFSCSTQACPRNLTEGRRCRKENKQKIKHAQSWGQVGWVLGWRQTTVGSTSSEFIIYSGEMRWNGSSWGRRHDIVILGNRRNLWLLLSECKHLREKQLYCILSTSAAGTVPTQACSLLGMTVLAPFCHWGCAKLKPAVYLRQLC